jgi:error-prone DNA polymerase
MPEALVDQAAAAGADFLALTDRDGLYGAVKHVRACATAGIRPGLGSDLDVHDDEHRPLGRVTLLAHGGDGRGYAALCRAVSSAHEAGRVPSIDRHRLATWAEGRTLTVECGRDCEPVPFDVSGQGIRIFMACPLHGLHTVVDPFEGSR